MAQEVCDGALQVIYENFSLDVTFKETGKTEQYKFVQANPDGACFWRSVIVAHGWSRITDDAQITKSIRDNKKWNIITHFKKTLYDLIKQYLLNDFVPKGETNMFDNVCLLDFDENYPEKYALLKKRKNLQTKYLKNSKILYLKSSTCG